MSRKLIFAKKEDSADGQRILALYEGQRPVEFYVTGTEKKLLHNIYLGMIEEVQEAMDAVFVRLFDGQRGYLSLKECSRAFFRSGPCPGKVKAGMELLVQVSKEAIKSKLPRLSADLTIQGKNVVVTTEHKGIRCSRKIETGERRRLETLLEETGELPYGVILRTNSVFCGPEELIKEYSRLLTLLTELIAKAPFRKVCTCLYQAPDEAIELLMQHLNSSLSEIVTDDEQLYASCETYLSTLGIERPPVLRFYEDRLLSLYHLYSMQSWYDRLLYREVHLKSGGFLTIEQTEACVVIDVNSGRGKGKHSREESLLALNLEACEEIASQIRLRQLSGIILVDFVNMEEASHRAAVMEKMRQLTAADPVRTKVVDYTSLQLMEITRRKEKKSFREQVFANNTVLC